MNASGTFGAIPSRLWGLCKRLSYIMFTAVNVYAEPSSCVHRKRLQEMAADVIGSPNSDAIV